VITNPNDYVFKDKQLQIAVKLEWLSYSTSFSKPIDYYARVLFSEEIGETVNG